MSDQKLSTRTETTDPTGGFVHIVKSLTSFKISVVNLVTSLFTSKAKVSAADTTENYLNDKITVTANLLKSITSPAADEKLLLDIAATIVKAMTFEQAVVLEDTLSVINASVAQYSAAVALMYSSAPSLGNNAGASFGSVITDGSATEAIFSIAVLNYLGVWVADLLVINLTTKAAQFQSQAHGGYYAKSFSASATFNANDGNNQYMPVTASTTIGLSNELPGVYVIKLEIDTAGSPTITIGASIGTALPNSVLAIDNADDAINIITIVVDANGVKDYTISN